MVALAAVVTLFVSHCGMRGGKARRNVVHITIDTLRADYVGCFGAPGARTPELDELAADGTIFTQATS
ncbi:MAG: sulfatase-like hydrolase/transferase, partial [Planctomycetota bacterium]